jgi:hypothetical protein
MFADGGLPEERAVRAYPNPASRQLFIDVAAADRLPVTISLVNAAGVIVKSQGFADGSDNGSSLTLDIEDVHDGLYLLRVEQGGRTEVTKVMVRQ